MAVKINKEDAVDVIVVGDFGVHYEGTDYYPGDTLTITEAWFANLSNIGRVRAVTDEDAKKTKKHAKES